MKTKHHKKADQNRSPEYQYLDLMREALEKGIKVVDRGTNNAIKHIW